MKPVELAPAARGELEAAIEWYDERSQGLGQRFFELVDEAFDAIAHTPEGYPRWEHDERVRKLTLDKFPYVIFYREHAATLEVVAISHTAREPGYWVERG